MLMQIKEIGQKLWSDETGAIISAEAVMVATLGVGGAVVGMDALSKSVNDELVDVALAIRSFDQSFCVRKRQSAGACMAGSQFQQVAVETSREELRTYQKELEARQQKQIEPSKKETPKKKEAPKKKKELRRKDYDEEVIEE